jgi:hypothetical protein
LREALALALDGALPDDERAASSAYRAAAATLPADIAAQMGRLRGYADSGLIWATARNDNTRRLLDALELRAQPTCGIPENDDWPGIIFLGCIQASRAAYGRWIARMLRRGAIVVSSDRCIEASVIAARLQTGRRRSERRARIMLRPDLADRMASDAGWGQVAGSMAPAVRLAPGHVPLTLDQHFEVDIFARDRFTDDPLVVRANVLNGQVVHSVAHWWQDLQPDLTVLGRRKLVDVPAFVDIGESYPDALFGSYAASSALLGCLLSGLDSALDRCGHVIPPSSASALASGD